MSKSSHVVCHMSCQKTWFKLFRASGLAPESSTVNEGASSSGSLSGGSSGGSSESPSQSLMEEAELNLPESENQSVSDTGKLSNSSL